MTSPTTSLKRILGRVKEYMPAVMVTVATTFIMVGFIFFADPNYQNFDGLQKFAITALILTGLILSIGMVFIVRYEDRKRSVRDEALLLTLIAIGNKLDVDMEELQKARNLIRKIDKVNKV
jgi:uncharacterized membrane protein